MGHEIVDHVLRFKLGSCSLILSLETMAYSVGSKRGRACRSVADIS
jgi:hypothetical protein